ncbi:MAG TPA: TonB-dependent receptor plug domain-containing protein, partial [Gemmatimonadales bacterium]|nr:TonB-dependent receptor plug domain-containing protein [Gemmatimonadales bacterium]
MTVHRIMILALAAPAVLAGPGRSQEPRDTFRLSDVVVTPTRIPTPRSAVPVSVTVISGEELRARGVHQVLDALRDVTGAAVAQVGGFGGVASLFLRGGESDYVTVLLDGVPLNQPGGAVDLGNLTTESL